MVSDLYRLSTNLVRESHRKKNCVRKADNKREPGREEMPSIKVLAEGRKRTKPFLLMIKSEAGCQLTQDFVCLRTLFPLVVKGLRI